MPELNLLEWKGEVLGVSAPGFGLLLHRLRLRRTGLPRQRASLVVEFHKLDWVT